jgi:glycosyltransferase involved in cell wall biosynthesis
MRVLFASDYPHLPENTGGLEVNTHELCLALSASAGWAPRGAAPGGTAPGGPTPEAATSGHTVAVLAALRGRGLTGALARSKLRFGLAAGFAVDHGLGYPVLRAWHPAEALGAAMEWFHPDVVVVQSWRFGMVAEVLRRGVAAVLYSHSAQSALEGIDDGLLAHCVLVANSAFNAGFQGSAIGARFEVLHPLINPHRYLCGGKRDHVVQVGLSLQKGAAVTLVVARQRPDIRFLVVQNWEGVRPRLEDEALHREAAALANLRVIPPDHDVRKLYRRARLLLVPSQWPETWGRVVNEAQVNAIPVVASNQGGLPEAVGSGGVILDWQAPAASWVAEVARLWDEPDWYAEMARRARARAAADDIRPDALLESFVTLLHDARARRLLPVGTD